MERTEGADRKEGFEKKGGRRVAAEGVDALMR